ncbi:MAG: imelysin family protein [Cytophagales bacterium]|nr:imelysin family protein [Cytophagales bacterium]
MKKTILLFLAIGFLWSCNDKDDDGSTTTTEFDKSALVNMIGHDIIDIDLQNLTSETASLVSIGKTKNLERLKTQWVETQKVWQTARIFKVSEIKNKFLLSPFYRYPIDTARIEKFILENDTFNLANESSLIKGLSALEYLIYQENAIDEIHWKYIQAVCEDLNNQSELINTTWKSDSEFYTNLNNSTDGSINQLVNSMIASLEETKVNKLSKPLYENTTTEAPYSQQSIELIQYNLEGIQKLYLGNETTGFDEYLKSLNQTQLDSDIKSQLTTCIEYANDIDTSLETSIESQNTQEIIKLYDAITELLVLVKVDMSSQLNIIVTFNDVDGD